MSPGDWGTAKALGGFGPLNDPYDRTVYTVHQYEPYAFTHEDDILSEEQVDGRLAKTFDIIRKWQNEHHLPVVVNEFGLDLTKKKATSIYFMEQQIKHIEAVSSGHAVWLWEVAKEGTYDFDIKQDPCLLALVVDQWRSNKHYPSTCLES